MTAQHTAKHIACICTTQSIAILHQHQTNTTINRASLARLKACQHRHSLSLTFSMVVLVALNRTVGLTSVVVFAGVFLFLFEFFSFLLLTASSWEMKGPHAFVIVVIGAPVVGLPIALFGLWCISRWDHIPPFIFLTNGSCS